MNGSIAVEGKVSSMLYVCGMNGSITVERKVSGMYVCGMNGSIAVERKVGEKSEQHVHMWHEWQHTLEKSV